MEVVDDIESTKWMKLVSNSLLLVPSAILGLPTCGAYSKATAADLLLPRLLSGEPASEKTVAKLGHGGILTRSQRFRFPPYARDLDAPDG